MKHLFTSLLVFASALLMTSFRAEAVDKTWTGATNADWNTASNWSPAGVPTANDRVTIPSTAHSPLIQNGATATARVVSLVSSLTVNSGAVLTISPIDGDAAGLSLTTGILTNKGSITIQRTAGGSGLTTGIVSQDNSALTNSGTITVGVNSVGLVTNSGSLTLINNRTGTISLAAPVGVNNAADLRLANYGTILIFGGESSFVNNGLLVLNNYDCAKIITEGDFSAPTGDNIYNTGLFQVGGRLITSNFTNSLGILKYGPLSGPVKNNFSLIVNDDPTTPIFTYGQIAIPPSSIGIYTDAEATNSAGSFTAPNSFTASSSLPSGLQTLYAKITLYQQTCSFVVPFTYRVKPALSGLSASPSPVCAGQAIQFTASLGNVSGGYSYTITNGSGTSQTGTGTGTAFSQPVTANGSGNQTFRLVVTSQGESSSTSVGVTVNPTPTLDPRSVADPTRCDTPNGQLSFTTNLADGTYAFTYRKDAGSPQSTSVAVTSGQFALTDLSGGRYYGFSLTTNGCTGTSSTTLGLSSPTTPPQVSITPSMTAICSGQSAQLTATGAATYQWRSGQTTAAISVMETGTYSVTGVASNGCSATASASVTVNPTPSPALVASGTLTCTQTSVTLTASGGDGYQFSTGATQSVMDGSKATVSQEGVYSVTALSAGGCSAIASATVSSSTALAAPTLQASSLTTVNQPISVTAIGCSEGTINWNTQGGTGTASGAVYTFSQPGSYTLSASCTLGRCTSPASSPLTLQILPGGFAITAVTMVSCELIDEAAGGYRVRFTPQYSGQNANPISFSVVNELLPTTNPAPYTIRLYTDNPAITLVANQTGNPEARFRYAWYATCQTGTTTNHAPTTTGIPSQTLVQGQPYQLSLSSYFSDPDGQGLTFTQTGLPVGLSLAGSLISGTPSVSGVSSVVITAIDPGGLSVQTSFQLTVRPAPTTPTGFTITGVSTVSCEVLNPGLRRLTFTPQYAGVSGSPISFSVVNEKLPTTDPGPYSLNLYTDNPAIDRKSVV